MSDLNGSTQETPLHLQKDVPDEVVSLISLYPTTTYPPLEFRTISPNEVPLQALSCWDLFETGLGVFCLVFGSVCSRSVAGSSASLCSCSTLSVRTISAVAQSLPAAAPLVLSLPRSFPCRSTISQLGTVS